MQTSELRKWFSRGTYLRYTIGCAVAWAVLWLLVGTLDSARIKHIVAYMFFGWVIGWVSASIARLVYPAPKVTLLSRNRGRVPGASHQAGTSH